MDFIDEVRTRSSRFAERTDHLETEEATKNALILPFLQMMGYSVFDPTEVVPEFTADVGSKKGEKVDYALMQDGKPTTLIECKIYGNNLDEAEISQLTRYFTVTDARFGILTDGVVYRFFSDLDQPNVMDTKPFFEFNMLDFSEAEVEGLKRFTKKSFNLDEILDAARELKYTTEIKKVIAQELESPSDEFVRFIIGRVYEGRATQTIREQFSSFVRHAFVQFINDRISDRLKSALKQEETEEKEAQEVERYSDPEPADELEVIELELEALNVIKAIVRDLVDVRRIELRPASQYCSVLLDDNNRRIFCRLRLRTKSLRLGLLNEKRQTKWERLEDLDDLFKHADSVRAEVSRIETSIGDA
ncbi:MAG: restriction endonuclease [Chloroflexi bacterium]|nr:restriction endonuclease [Chloroflexota bacterium]